MRRQAVKPAIGHLKSDHRMDRCRLRGALGDALHAVLCGAGYELRWPVSGRTHPCQHAERKKRLENGYAWLNNPAIAYFR